MLSAEHPGVSVFLWLTGAFFLVVFALPLLLAPLAWARLFRWRVPAAGADTDLTVYLGRCLGAVAVALVTAAFVAAPDPRRHSVLLLTFAVAAALLTAVHAWGAIRRVQPWTEHVEIGMYGAVTAVAGWLWWQLR